MNQRKSRGLLLVAALCLLLLPAASAWAAEHDHAATTAADAAPAAEDAAIAAELGLLIGEGNGVDEAYLAKQATRIQAAIISLRLRGELDNALAHGGTDTFADAALTGTYHHPILAYLKANPALGWSGAGNGTFMPLDAISAQQFYKVLLEALGYRSGTDFAYADTEPFAASKGLMKIAGTAELTNAHIATALAEALYAEPKAGGGTLFASLRESGVLAADAALPEQPAATVKLGFSPELGNYFTDGSGMTLYLFAKDAADPNSCTEQCLANWPLYYAEDLVVPASLNPKDFGVLVREDGAKQTTYRGWPLYTFAKDVAAGDTNGEAVGGVWFAAKSDYRVMIGTNETLGSYLTDGHGRTLYYFDRDTPQTSACEGPCIANWLPYGAAAGSVPTGLSADDFGSIARKDGTTQATFKGYPLYYFVKDAVVGDTTGHGVNDVWFVVDPAKFTGTKAAESGGGATAADGGQADGGQADAAETDGGQTDAAEAKTYKIDIKDFSFGTEPLTVEAGSKVTFTNFDDMKHNAAARDGSFETPLLAKGESFTITLDKPGTYEYVCEPHKNFMIGTIIVK